MTHAAEDLDRYLRILAGDDPTGRLIEIRSTIPDGMRQTFTPATRPELAAKTITRLAARTDVYVGVLLRHRRGGGRDACERSHLAFIEIDRPDGAQRLARYRYPPTMVISSGGIIRSPRCDRPPGSEDACRRHVADGASRSGSRGSIGSWACP